MELFSTWQFNLLLSIVFTVIFTQYFKLASKTQKNDGAMTILAQFIGGISILVLVPFFGLEFPSDWRVWGLLGIAIIFYAINDRLHTTTRKHLDVSTENITRQLSKVFMMISGIVFFHEDMVMMKIIGGLLIILSSVFLVMKGKGKFEWNRYLILQLISIVAFTIALSLDVGISSQFNLPIYVSITLIIPAVLIWIGERVPYKKIVQEYTTGNRFAIIVTGCSRGFSILFGLRAYQFGEVSVVAPLSALAVLCNVILAYIFLGEREHLLRKLFAAVGVVIGVLLIY